jgi:hypothetical protein
MFHSRILKDIKNVRSKCLQTLENWRKHHTEEQYDDIWEKKCLILPSLGLVLWAWDRINVREYDHQLLWEEHVLIEGTLKDREEVDVSGRSVRFYLLGLYLSDLAIEYLSQGPTNYPNRKLWDKWKAPLSVSSALVKGSEAKSNTNIDEVMQALSHVKLYWGRLVQLSALLPGSILDPFYMDYMKGALYEKMGLNLDQMIKSHLDRFQVMAYLPILIEKVSRNDGCRVTTDQGLPTKSSEPSGPVLEHGVASVNFTASDSVPDTVVEDESTKAAISKTSEPSERQEHNKGAPDEELSDIPTEEGVIGAMSVNSLKQVMETMTEQGIPTCSVSTDQGLTTKSSEPSGPVLGHGFASVNFSASDSVPDTVVEDERTEAEISKTSEPSERQEHNKDAPDEELSDIPTDEAVIGAMSVNYLKQVMEKMTAVEFFDIAKVRRPGSPIMERHHVLFICCCPVCNYFLSKEETYHKAKWSIYNSKSYGSVDVVVSDGKATKYIAHNGKTSGRWHFKKEIQLHWGALNEDQNYWPPFVLVTSKKDHKKNLCKCCMGGAELPWGPGDYERYRLRYTHRKKARNQNKKLATKKAEVGRTTAYPGGPAQKRHKTNKSAGLPIHSVPLPRNIECSQPAMQGDDVTEESAPRLQQLGSLPSTNQVRIPPIPRLAKKATHLLPETRLLFKGESPQSITRCLFPTKLGIGGPLTEIRECDVHLYLNECLKSLSQGLKSAEPEGMHYRVKHLAKDKGEVDGYVNPELWKLRKLLELALNQLASACHTALSFENEDTFGTRCIKIPPNLLSCQKNGDYEDEDEPKAEVFVNKVMATYDSFKSRHIARRYDEAKVYQHPLFVLPPAYNLLRILALSYSSSVFAMALYEYEHEHNFI